MRDPRWPWAAVAVLILLGSPETDPLRAQRPEAPDALRYLVLDAATGRVIESQWDDLERPLPVGSLVKPFTALAYANAHRYVYPRLTCTGTGGRCWLPSGHGVIGIAEAVAHSCNAYFFALAQSVAPDAFAFALRGFGLPPGAAPHSPDTMVGLGDSLTVSPVTLARAYLELAARSDQPGVAPLVRGMRLSAQSGTGAGVGRALHLAPALVKTGTSPCAHAPRAEADGYVVALYPADAPRLVMVVSAHGRTGADTAAMAGPLLARAAESRP
jgi:cell division protein FtsI/penicillin-binding protein 2